MVDFGSRLKELRKQSGLTQEQLAARIGVTKSVISFYELRERSPSPEVLAKLSYIFHVSTDYLLGIERGRTIDVSDLDDEDIKAVQQIVHRLSAKNKNK
ncbi:MAG: helix-turn-helix transcriptional regulator [Ruminococcus sp.]|nr:helix-turn-helix transcriptional regulator [Ruminococcus sp.]